ncbi:LysR substrate-binding domain-containing protein [Tepidimonas aquatica]|nr:LysR substrate-binding domain-containing protein [Tepidimonas aquatica]
MDVPASGRTAKDQPPARPPFNAYFPGPDGDAWIDFADGTAIDCCPRTGTRGFFSHWRRWFGWWYAGLQKRALANGRYFPSPAVLRVRTSREGTIRVEMGFAPGFLPGDRLYVLATRFDGRGGGHTCWARMSLCRRKPACARCCAWRPSAGVVPRKQAVMAGMGLSFLSLRTVRRELAAGHMALLDICGMPIVGKWYVTHLSQKKLSPAAQAFKKFLIEPAEPLNEAWA